MAIVLQSNGTKYPTLISSQAEVPAKIFQSLANAGGFKAQGLLSLGSSYDAYEINNLPISSGKMLKECCLQEADGILPTSLLLFPKAGMLSGGKFSTPKISVFLKTESVFLSLVLEKEVPKKYFLSDKMQKMVFKEINLNRGGRLHLQDEAQGGGNARGNYIQQLNNPKHSNDRVYEPQGLSPALNTMQGGNRQPFIRTTKDGFHLARNDEKKSSIQGTHVTFEEGKSHALGTAHVPMVVAQRGRNPQNPKSRKSGLPTEQRLEPNLNGTSNALTSVEKDNYVFDGEVRKLMPIECERLMSWQDNHTKYGVDDKGNKVEISDSQRYKMCGNGVVSNCVRALIENVLRIT